MRLGGRLDASVGEAVEAGEGRWLYRRRGKCRQCLMRSSLSETLSRPRPLAHGMSGWSCGGGANLNRAPA